MKQGLTSDDLRWLTHIENTGPGKQVRRIPSTLKGWKLRALGFVRSSTQGLVTTRAGHVFPEWQSNP
jgi:hypothetical protein